MGQGWGCQMSLGTVGNGGVAFPSTTGKAGRGVRPAVVAVHCGQLPCTALLCVLAGPLLVFCLSVLLAL